MGKTSRAAESDLLSGKYDYIFKQVLDFYLGRSLTLADMQAFMEGLTKIYNTKNQDILLLQGRKALSQTQHTPR